MTAKPNTTVLSCRDLLDLTKALQESISWYEARVESNYQVGLDKMDIRIEARGRIAELRNSLRLVESEIDSRISSNCLGTGNAR